MAAWANGAKVFPGNTTLNIKKGSLSLGGIKNLYGGKLMNFSKNVLSFLWK